jgi:hypothetical protein
MSGWHNVAMIQIENDEIAASRQMCPIVTVGGER